MKRIIIFLTALLLAFCTAACTAENPPKSEAESAESGVAVPHSENKAVNNYKKETDAAMQTEMKMNVQIGENTFTATLEDNAAVREFIEMMKKAPVSVEMSDYSGFEKVGALGKNLASDDRQTMTAAGDIVLYNSNQIVMFYGSNTWSYTRLGHIDDLAGWEDTLGDGDITAVFTILQ